MLKLLTWRPPPRSASDHLLCRHFSLTTSSEQKHYNVLSQELFDALKTCEGPSTASRARAIHARLVSIGLSSSSIFLQNNLLSTYFNCGLPVDGRQVFDEIHLRNVYTWNIMITGLSNTGCVDDARQLFDKMTHRDSASWSAMMSGYFKNEMNEETVETFISMLRAGKYELSIFTLTCMMKACGALRFLQLGHQLHALVKKFDFVRNAQVQGSLIDMYSKSGDNDAAASVFEGLDSPNLYCWNSVILAYSKLYGVDYAVNVFNRMPERDVVSWNMIISVLSRNGLEREALVAAVNMHNHGFKLDSTTYSSILSACASTLNLIWGKHLHACVMRSERSLDVFVGSSLVDMYAKCGEMDYAKRTFHVLPERNVVSWTALISGFVQCGRIKQAMELFNQMKAFFAAIDQFTLATVVSACCSQKDLCLGAQLHAYSTKIGYGASTPVSNALVTMYAKCGSVCSAEHVFQSMPTRDVISWTSMITAYSQLGNIIKAREYFDNMSIRNIVTWNAMIGAYVQYGNMEAGLKLYNLMLRDGNFMPDWITFLAVLSACADAGAVRLGNQIMAHTIKLAFNLDISVANGTIMMYSKCGRIIDARKVFNSINEKDLVSWNSMITAYAQSGQGKEAVETFEYMLLEGIPPDYISYVAVLSGCSHSGLVDQGRSYFNSMTKIHKILPGLEHYSCMVDLLGRAGLLEEAKNVIDNMSVEPTAEVWGALLGACKLHGNMDLAECAMTRLVELDSKDSGSYVLLAKIYSDAGKFEDHAKVRKLMKERGIKKNPGCSWIEVNSNIHVFTADDANHPQIQDIQQMLDELIKKIEAVGYRNEAGFRSESRHSEKLAVAFALMSLPPWEVIHIMKNLRICGDCHIFIKLLSLVTKREFIVRDANRFHHFREGHCSCRDYW